MDISSTSAVGIPPLVRQVPRGCMGDVPAVIGNMWPAYLRLPEDVYAVGIHKDQDRSTLPSFAAQLACIGKAFVNEFK